MGFDARAWFIFTTFFLLIGGWYAYEIIQPNINTQQNQTFTERPYAERTVLHDGRPDAPGNPFIRQIEIINETPSKLVFEVLYFHPDQIEGTYNISIHPNMGDWSYSANTMREGVNREIITVSFRGEESRSAQSDALHIYINHYDEKRKKWMGKVFERTVRFEKNWQK